ncbi:MAG TPA: amidohydrolase family protein [Acetobacteraceae bacterium]
MSEALLERTRPAETRLELVDCDIHPVLRSSKALHPYLPHRWREELDARGFRTRNPFLNAYAYPKAAPALSRRDSWPPGGAPPGGDLDFMRAQHLDHYGVDIGILQVLGPSGKDIRNQEFGAAVARGLNDWQIAEWTEPEPRLRGSITVTSDDPDAAVEEIARCAPKHDFASVFISARTTEPMGRKRYRPIFAAAVDAGLPIGIHAGGANGIAMSSAGAPSYYLEDHQSGAAVMQSLLTSLVFEGVFERFPALRIVLVEGGFGWLPALLWRMDRQWARMRDEVPHVKRPPSEYVRRNVWVATQPIAEPEHAADMAALLDWIGRDRIVFSSDYPHWDMDDPRLAFKVALSEAEQRMIFSDNARAVYRLG